MDEVASAAVEKEEDQKKTSPETVCLTRYPDVWCDRLLMIVDSSRLHMFC